MHNVNIFQPLRVILWEYSGNMGPQTESPIIKFNLVCS